jgi:SHS2 domain-containing protein
MGDEPGYEFVEGATSDLAFVAHGPTLEERDLELLLMRFLNELVYLRDAESLLLYPERILVTHDGHARLEGELAGERIDPARHALATDVKAATAHGLRVSPTAEGWTAAVTLDV